MTMDKIGLTISITNLETVYDGNKSFEYTNSNLPSNIVCTGTLADGDNITKIKISINEKDVNTYTLADNNVEVSVFAGSDNVSDRSNCYSISVNNGSQLKITLATITVTPDSKSKTYGEFDPELTYECTGNVSGEIPGFDGGLKRESGEDVGAYVISNNDLVLQDYLSFKATNYILKFSETISYLTISKADTTVTVTGTSQTVTYNGSEQSVSGFTTSTLPDGVTISLKNGSTAEAKGTNVGTYKMNLTADAFEAVSNNYNVTLTVVDGVLTISKADTTVTVTGTSQTVTYNGSEQSVSGFTTSTLPDGVTISLKNGSTAEAKGTNVGTYKMNLTADAFEAVSNNYNVTLTVVDGVLTISKADTTVTVTDAKLTDGNVWIKSFEGLIIHGLVDGDSITSGTLSTTDSAIGKYNYTGTDATYSQTLGDDFIWTVDLNTINGIGNYSITYNLHVTITDKKTYTVTFDSNGGSEVKTETVKIGQHITKPTDPTRSGYKFVGWYKEQH